MASNKNPREFRMRDLRGLSEARNAEAYAKYKAKASSTDVASEIEFKKEKTKLDSTSMTYMKAVIRSTNSMVSSQQLDLPLCAFINGFKLMAEKDPKNKAVALANLGLDSSDEEYTDEQMRDDLYERTDTPFYPWFQDHVKRSARRSFTPEYFMMGLVEEINKYKQERSKGEVGDWPPVGKQMDEVISRAGNVYWYIYGLCSGMEDVIPETVEDDGYDWFYADVRELLGSLCGSVRKLVQGDQDWAVLRPQVQASVSRLLRYIRERSVRFTTPEMAMRFNIAKIRGRAFEKGDLREEMSYTGAAMKIHTNDGPMKVTDIRAMGDKMKAAEMKEFMKNLNLD